jgi:hypothetical protein
MVWGIKLDKIELGATPTDKQITNISFKHTRHTFERVEEFEIDEFLSSQLNC